MTYEEGIELEMARIWDERGDVEFPSERQFDQLRQEAEENIKE